MEFLVRWTIGLLPHQRIFSGLPHKLALSVCVCTFPMIDVNEKAECIA